MASFPRGIAAPRRPHLSPRPARVRSTRVVCRGGTFAVLSSTTASEEECRSKGPPDASLLDASDAAADGDAPSDAASDGD